MKWMENDVRRAVIFVITAFGLVTSAPPRYYNKKNHPLQNKIFYSDKTQVIYYGCKDVVCSYSKLLKEDKIKIVDKMNEFRNRVAGGNFRNYPYCVNEVNKVIWDEKIAAVAQKDVNECRPVKIYNHEDVDELVPRDTESPPVPPFTKDFDSHYETIKIGTEICDIARVIEKMRISENNSQSYDKAKNSVLNFISRGQMEDFWRKSDDNGNWKIIFGRSGTKKIGCGYMLRQIEQQNVRYLLSYFTCIYCSVEHRMPLISAPPCKGCTAVKSFSNVKNQRVRNIYNKLCVDQKTRHKYGNIPNDSKQKSICITMDNAYQNKIFKDKFSDYEDAEFISTLRDCPPQPTCTTVKCEEPEDQTKFESDEELQFCGGATISTEKQDTLSCGQTIKVGVDEKITATAETTSTIDIAETTLVYDKTITTNSKTLKTTPSSEGKTTSVSKTVEIAPADSEKTTVAPETAKIFTTCSEKPISTSDISEIFPTSSVNTTSISKIAEISSENTTLTAETASTSGENITPDSERVKIVPTSTEKTTHATEIDETMHITDEQSIPSAKKTITLAEERTKSDTKTTIHMEESTQKIPAISEEVSSKETKTGEHKSTTTESEYNNSTKHYATKVPKSDKYIVIPPIHIKPEQYTRKSGNHTVRGKIIKATGSPIKQKTTSFFEEKITSAEKKVVDVKKFKGNHEKKTSTTDQSKLYPESESTQRTPAKITDKYIFSKQKSTSSRRVKTTLPSRKIKVSTSESGGTTPKHDENKTSSKWYSSTNKETQTVYSKIPMTESVIKEITPTSKTIIEHSKYGLTKSKSTDITKKKDITTEISPIIQVFSTGIGKTVKENITPDHRKITETPIESFSRTEMTTEETILKKTEVSSKETSIKDAVPSDRKVSSKVGHTFISESEKSSSKKEIIHFRGKTSAKGGARIASTVRNITSPREKISKPVKETITFEDKKRTYETASTSTKFTFSGGISSDKSSSTSKLQTVSPKNIKTISNIKEIMLSKIQNNQTKYLNKPASKIKGTISKGKKTASIDHNIKTTIEDSLKKDTLKYKIIVPPKFEKATNKDIKTFSKLHYTTNKNDTIGTGEDVDDDEDSDEDEDF